MSVPANIRVNIPNASVYGDIITDPLDPTFYDANVYSESDPETLTNKTLMDPSNNVAANYIKSGDSFLTIENTGSIIPDVGTVLTVKSEGVLGFVAGGGGSGGSVISVCGKTGVVVLDKNDIGLSNVDNTSDYNKPVSLYTQQALDQKVGIGSLGLPNGTASLDATGRLKTSQIPNSILVGTSYVGTYNASTGLPAIPIAGADNRGNIYAVSVAGDQIINGSLYSFNVGDLIISNGTSWDVIGTSNNVVSVNGFTGAVTIDKSSIGLSNVNNTSDLAKPISEATQSALDTKMSFSDVVNTLTIGDPLKPLSSAMGYQLQTLKLAVTDIINDLSSTVTNKALSANMGKQLNDSLGTKASIADIPGIVDPLINNAITTLTPTVVLKSSINQISGVPGLDNTGRMSFDQLPTSLTAALTWRGAWDANANSPLILPASAGTLGYMYQVSTPGIQSINGFPQTYSVGEFIISNGTMWETVPNSVTVSSVNSKIGAVVLSASDIGLGNVDNTSDINKPISIDTQAAINLKVSKTDIVNDLNSVDSSKVLSAAQGQILNSSKISRSEVINDLTTGGNDLPLSATQGTILNTTKINTSKIVSGLSGTDPTTVLSGTVGPMITGLISQKIGVSDIVNSLTDSSTNKALSALQGKNLNDSKIAKTDIYVGLDSVDPNQVLSATIGATINSNINTKIAKTSIYNALDSSDSTKVLGASVGSLVIPKTDIINSLVSVDNSKPMGAAQGPVITNLIDQKISNNQIMIDPAFPAGKTVMSSTLYNNFMKPADIINNVTSTDTDKPLSAAMGKYLEDNKMDQGDIINSLTSTDTTKPLAAAQGKILNDSMAGMLVSGDIINNLVSSASNKVLGASQGPILTSLISSKLSSADIVNDLATNNATKVLSAAQGFALQNNKLGADVIVNNLTSTDNAKVLSASVGPTITSLINGRVNKTDIIDNLTTNDATKVLSASQGPAIVTMINNGLSSALRVTDLVTNLSSTDSTKPLAASVGPMITSVSLRPWLQTNAYASGQCVLYNDHVFTANGDILGGTTFDIGTTGQTWKLVYDLPMPGPNVTISNITSNLSAIIGSPTDFITGTWSPTSSSNFNKYYVVDAIRYISLPAGTVAFTNLQMLYNPGGTWLIIDRPYSGNWFGPKTYYGRDFADLKNKSIAVGDQFVETSVNPNMVYEATANTNPDLTSSWSLVSKPDIFYAGFGPFVDPSTIKSLPMPGVGNSYMTVWPSAPGDINYTVYTSANPITYFDSPTATVTQNAAILSGTSGVPLYVYVRRSKDVSPINTIVPPANVSKYAFPIEMSMTGKKIYTGAGVTTALMITTTNLNPGSAPGTRLPTGTGTLSKIQRLSVAINSSYDLNNIFAGTEYSVDVSAATWDANTQSMRLTCSSAMSSIYLGMPGYIYSTTTSTYYANYVQVKAVSGSYVYVGRENNGNALPAGSKLYIYERRSLEILVNPESIKLPVSAVSATIADGQITVVLDAMSSKAVSVLPLDLLTIRIADIPGEATTYTNQAFPIVSYTSSTNTIIALTGISGAGTLACNNMFAEIGVAKNNINRLLPKNLPGSSTNTNAIVIYNAGPCLCDTYLDANSVDRGATYNAYHFSTTNQLYSISPIYLDNTVRMGPNKSLLTQKYLIPNNDHINMSHFGTGLVSVRAKYGAAVVLGWLDSYGTGARFSLGYQKTLYTANSMSVTGGPYNQANATDDNLNVVVNPNYYTWIPYGGSQPVSDSWTAAANFYKYFGGSSLGATYVASSTTDLSYTGYDSAQISTIANNPWAGNDVGVYGKLVKFTNFMAVPSGSNSCCVYMYYDAANNKLFWSSATLTGTTASWRSVTLTSLGITTMSTKPASIVYPTVQIISDDLNSVQISLDSVTYLLEFDWDSNSVVNKFGCTVLNPYSWSTEEASNATCMPTVNGGRLLCYQSAGSTYNGDGTFTVKAALYGKIGESNINTVLVNHNFNGTATNMSGSGGNNTARTMNSYGWAACNSYQGGKMVIFFQGHDDEIITMYNTAVSATDDYHSWIGTSISCPTSVPGQSNISTA